MHRRRLPLLAAMLLASIASRAGAQSLHQVPEVPTYFVVNVAPANFTWTVNKVVWGSAPLRTAEPRLEDRAQANLQQRLGSKPGSNSVELISPTQRSDSSLARWLHSGATPVPMDVTITAMSASRTPVARWLLHRTVPTRVQLNQMDAGASQIALTHVTLTAQSVTVLPSGS